MRVLTITRNVTNCRTAMLMLEHLFVREVRVVCAGQVTSFKQAPA